MSTKFTTTLNEDEVEVEYHYYAGCSGTYYQPPEDAEAEIVGIWYKGVDIISIVNDKDYNALCDKACENEQACYIDYLEYKAECEHEERMIAKGYADGTRI